MFKQGFLKKILKKISLITISCYSFQHLQNQEKFLEKHLNELKDLKENLKNLK